MGCFPPTHCHPLVPWARSPSLPGPGPGPPASLEPRLARQAESDGIDKVFEAAEAATALMEQAQPLVAQAAQLVDQLTPLLAELRAGGLVSRARAGRGPAGGCRAALPLPLPAVRPSPCCTAPRLHPPLLPVLGGEGAACSCRQVVRAHRPPHRHTTCACSCTCASCVRRAVRAVQVGNLEALTRTAADATTDIRKLQVGPAGARQLVLGLGGAWGAARGDDKPMPPMPMGPHGPRNPCRACRADLHFTNPTHNLQPQNLKPP